MQAIVAGKSCRWGFFFTLQEISLTKAESCSAAVATAVEVSAPVLIMSDVVAAVAGAEQDCKHQDRSGLRTLFGRQKRAAADNVR